MVKKGLLYILILFAFINTAVLTGPGCANIIPPGGGPRDTLAPVLLKVDPADSTRNFDKTRIQFTFDEFVDVQNIQEEVLVSPTPRIRPAIDFKLNTVTVRLKDSLEPNTTYTIAFGNSIRDINESNTFKNFTYVFTTGSYLDSLEFTGKVMLAETGVPDTTMIVMLHANGDDSAVVRDKPRYVAKLDNQGNFHFRNLPPRKFYVYALKDEGGIYRYFDGKQLFAFADSAVTISQNTPPVTLYAYLDPPKTTAATKTTAGANSFRNRPNNATAADRRLKWSTTLSNNQQDLLKEFYINFEQPLKNFDSTKLNLFIDSSFLPAPPYRFVLDSTATSIHLITSWKENTLYRLVLDKDFAEDSSGKKLLKTDTLNFRTRRLAEYAQVKIRIKNLDLSTNPVLQFVLNNAVTNSYPMTSNELSIPLFMPGEYELRILFDRNKNGQWDPGEFFGKRKQPELVRPIGRKVNIRPNWENEFEIML